MSIPGEKKFPSRLRQLRTQGQLTQVQLAEKFGFTGKAVSTWEKGTREPGIADLVRLAEVFNCTLDFLMGQDTPPPPPVEIPGWLEPHLEALASLDPAGRKAVVALIQGLRKP
jgi:transcriptional regulator with XRE-family HTH domain